MKVGFALAALTSYNLHLYPEPSKYLYVIITALLNYMAEFKLAVKLILF